MKEALLALAALLAPGNPELIRELTAALEQPAVYLEKHEGTKERLWASKDAAKDPRLPWLALVDLLIDAHRAVELDWNFGAEDVIWNLEQLDSWKDLGDERKKSVAAIHGDGPTIEVLRAAAAQLAADHRVLAALDIDSDSYVMVLLGESDYAKAAELARRAGFTLKDIRHFDPNA